MTDRQVFDTRSIKGDDGSMSGIAERPVGEVTSDVPSALPDLPPDTPVAVDTETSGRHPDDGARVSVVSLAWFTGDGDRVTTRVFPFNQGVTKWKSEWNGQGALFGEDYNLPVSEWAALMSWLRGRRLVMHNSNFDIMMIRAGVGRPDGAWGGVDLSSTLDWDTMLGNREIWPTELVGLKPTATRLGLLNPDMWDDPELHNQAFWRGRFGTKVSGWFRGIEASDEKALKAHLRKNFTGRMHRYDLVDWNVIAPYAALDAELTIRLWMTQQRWFGINQEEPSRAGASEAFGWAEREHRFRRVLEGMERRGMGFDITRCREAAVSIAREQVRVASGIPFGSAPGTRLNRVTLPAARAYWFEEKLSNGMTRCEPYSLTETGQAQLTSETVGKMVRDGVQWAPEYDRYKKLGDSISKWYEPYPDAVGDDGRLRPVFRQASVKSSRLAVERINLLAIPKDFKIRERLPDGVPTIKDLITAKPGHDLWSMDLGQAELRIGARWAKCWKMVDMFTEGVDLHGYTTKTIFGCTEDDPQWSEYRQVGKTGNLSLEFGAGARTFRGMLSRQAGVDWPERRCAEFVEAWRATYPEFPRANRQCADTVYRRGYVKLKNGKLSFFTSVERYQESQKGFNRFVQASLAEFSKDFMLWIDDNFPGLLVNWVHDAAYLEVPHGEEWKVDAIEEYGLKFFREFFDIVGSIDKHVEARGER